MATRLAINGYGRIGRCVLRALYERGLSTQMQVVAINDTGPAEALIHLTRYDSTHGRFNERVTASADGMLINGDAVRLLHQPEPEHLPWGDLGVDLVLECSGLFASRSGADAHLHAGAARVLIGAPAGPDMDLTLVYGVNHEQLSADMRAISCASCTTNCMAHLVAPLQAHYGITAGLFTTVHAYTNDQHLVDAPHHDLRRARAAGQAIVPTTTWANRALDWVLPEIAGRLQGHSMRVPVLNVSALELTLVLEQPTTADAVNTLMRERAATSEGVLAWCDEPLVSADFIHHPASAIYDATLTKTQGPMLRLLGWYDNEWGYANRLLDTIGYWLRPAQ